MRILVTGGSGFIGTNLVEAWVSAGHEVLNLDQAAPQNPAHTRFFVQADLLDTAGVTRAVKGFSPDHVVHMGARTDLVSDPDGSAYAVNTEGTRNLIGAMRAAGTVERCIFASTKLVCRNGVTPVSNEDFSPDTDYGASKAAMERLIRATQMPWAWCIVRPTSIWGPWFHVPYRGFFLAVARGRYFQLGSVDPPRSFGYVGNLVFQVTRLLGAPAGEIQGRVFYLTDYEQYRISEWAAAIARELGRREPRTMPEGLVQLMARTGDVLKALGWKNVPMTSFRLQNMRTDTSLIPLDNIRAVTGLLPASMAEGVRQTVGWLRGQGLI